MRCESNLGIIDGVTALVVRAGLVIVHRRESQHGVHYGSFPGERLVDVTGKVQSVDLGGRSVQSLSEHHPLIASYDHAVTANAPTTPKHSSRVDCMRMWLSDHPRLTLNDYS